MRVPRSFSSMPSSALRNLRGSRRLRGREFARRGADLLGETRQVIGHLLAIVDHLVDFLGGRGALLLAGGASGILPRHQVAHMIRLLLLPGRQLFGRLGHRVEAAGCVLLLHAAEQVGGLAQAVGGTAGIGRTALWETARRMSSLAWRKRSSACWAAC